MTLKKHILKINKIKSVKSGLKYPQDIQIKGSFIVIEGSDASGRSTQIQKITTKLEAEGHAVINAGLGRSGLVSKGNKEAKRNFLLGKRTMALYYAADFADQMENKIIPALKAGFIVISDRYIYTPIARSSVRGINKNWLNNLFSFAIKPDMVFYLDVDSYNLINRVFQKKYSLDYYESGVDLGISNDTYDSFIKYQYNLKKEFEKVRSRYGLITITEIKILKKCFNKSKQK